MEFGATIADLPSALTRIAHPNMISGNFSLHRNKKAHALSSLSPLSILQLLTIPTLEEAWTHIVLTEQLFTFHFRLGAEHDYLEKGRKGVSKAHHVNRTQEQGETLAWESWPRISPLGNGSDLRTRSGCKLIFVCSQCQIKLLFERATFLCFYFCCHCC